MLYMAALKPLSGAELTAQDWFGIFFMAQMFATGFVTVILAPLKGPDVALGKEDLLHCFGAVVYVLDHFLVYELLLNVPLDGGWLWNDPSYRWTRVPWGPMFAFFSGLCGLFQFLRSWDDKYSKQIHSKVLVSLFGKRSMSYASFNYCTLLGFMVTENLLFVVFLLGMTDGLEH